MEIKQMNKRYLSDIDIREAVTNISFQMFKDQWHPDYIVGITRGGLIPAVMMSHVTGVKMYTLDVRLRDGGENSDNESNLWMAEDAFGYFQQGHGQEGKKILIIDDINDTGATFEWIKQDWPSGCFPDDPAWNDVWHKNVRFASCVENLSSEFSSDYSFIEINKAENDEWIVFPWER
jgi:hypoxanthine phosphoribosyltransferase